MCAMRFVNHKEVETALTCDESNARFCHNELLSYKFKSNYCRYNDLEIFRLTRKSRVVSSYDEDNTRFVL